MSYGCPKEICENCDYWNGTKHDVTADCSSKDDETDFDDTCPDFIHKPHRPNNEVAA